MMTTRVLIPLLVMMALFGCQDAPTVPDEPTDGTVKPVELKIDSLVPDFTLNDPDGRAVSLSDFRGKVVLLDFWATWCAPCVDAVPELQDLARRYTGKDLVILSISLDRSTAAWKLFIQRNAMNWVHVFDDGGSGSPSLRYGIDAIPTALLIDRSGRLLGMAHSTLGLDAQIEAAMR